MKNKLWPSGCREWAPPKRYGTSCAAMSSARVAVWAAAPGAARASATSGRALSTRWSSVVMRGLLSQTVKIIHLGSARPPGMTLLDAWTFTSLPPAGPEIRLSDAVRHLPHGLRRLPHGLRRLPHGLRQMFYGVR